MDKYIEWSLLYKKPEYVKGLSWTLMELTPLKVDMICSLGGDCIAAAQQKVRGLRKYALPFDWCSFNHEKSLDYLADQFQNKFSDFALKENLKPITNRKFGYIDIKSGYSFIHHFQQSIDYDGEYERFRIILNRRIDRLYENIEKSNTILFLISKTIKFKDDCMDKIDNVFKKIYPNKKFYFIMATYNSIPSGIYNKNNKTIIRIPRDRNLIYDLKEKVFEWSFLDNVKLKIC